MAVVGDAETKAAPQFLPFVCSIGCDVSLEHFLRRRIAEEIKAKKNFHLLLANFFRAIDPAPEFSKQ